MWIFSLKAEIKMTSFLSMPRIYKRLITVVIDVLFIYIAFFGALYTRLEAFEFQGFAVTDYTILLLFVVIFTLTLFVEIGLYRAVLRYLSIHALFSIVLSCFASAIILVISSYFTGINMPRTVPIIYATYLVILSGGARLFIRLLVSDQKTRQKKRVLIYGAGESGRQLVNLLRQGNEFHPIAFIDDNKKLKGSVINGLRIYSRDALELLIKRKHINKVLLSIPSVSRAIRKSIINYLVDFPVEVLSIPYFEHILNGSASLDQLQEVQIEDLLGRDPVPTQPELLKMNIKNKIVMVTGAGGSIGSELCRQIVLQKPAALILFELSEFALYKIEKELNEFVAAQQLELKMIPLLGSVQRQARLERVLKSFNVQTLYHAAAYKHVPLVEYNVVEGVRNNVFGTYYTALAAIEAKVESFVLISTDKAVRPTNVMGTTKRMAELSLQSLATQKHDTRFCMVRFGNVLGSSGSVIPLFKRQIAQGDHVTITHPDITRYFMTIPEAASLVIQAGAMGKGGDVFVLDMGESVRIVDLATNLIKLSGLEVKSSDNPLGDIEIKFTGLRPGEKLFEELLIGNDVKGSEHERIMQANENFLPYDEYKLILDKLDRACHKFDHEAIREIFFSAPTGFNPTDGIGDLVWKVNQ